MANIQRSLLASGYKDALKGLMEANGTLESLAKSIASIKTTDSDGKKFIDLVVASIRESTKEVSTTINRASNKQLVDGLLFSLANRVSKDWLGDPAAVKGKAYQLDVLVQNGYIVQNYVTNFQKTLNTTITRVFKSLEVGNKSKGLLHDVIKSADWKGLGGGVAEFASTLTPFGTILNEVGGFAYRAWEKQNEASFDKRAPGFQENVQNKYGGQTWEDSTSAYNAGGFNAQGTGGTTGGGGGWAGGVQSGIQFDPRLRGGRFTKNGTIISNKEGLAGLNNDPLFVFFNKNAYAAGWTKDVLSYLKDLKGGNSGNNGLSGLLGNLAKLLPMIGSLLAVAGAAFAGWAAGRWLGEHVKWGKKGKTLDQHTAQAESHVMQGWDHLTGKYNFVPKERQLLDQQRGVANMTPAQMAQLNTELRARAAGTTGVKATGTEAASIAVLQQLLAEVKKQNVEKKEKSTSTTSTTTQRVIHDDIGDTVAELINCSVVGQPRK